MLKTALVAGGTGLVGEILIDKLILGKDYSEVKVVIQKGRCYNYHRVSIIEVDYDRLSDYKSELKADVVFCCLGAIMKTAGSKEQFHKVDFTYAFELAKIAQENKCEQFNIITASGANSKSMFFYNRVKSEIEEAISQLDLTSVNIFRPSLLLGVRYEYRPGERIWGIAAKIINPLLFGKFKKYRAIQAEIVAGAMVKVSLENQKGILIIESDIIQGYGQDYLKEERIFFLQEREKAYKSHYNPWQ